MAAQKRTHNASASNYELMETIRKYPVIYDKACDDVLEKKEAWAAAASELGVDVAEAQGRYGNVRTVFSRYLKGLRRRRPGGQGDGGTGRLSGDVKLKEEFEYLRWLIPYIRPRNCDSKRKHGRPVDGAAEYGDYSSPDEEYGEMVVEGGDMWTDLLKEAISASESYKVAAAAAPDGNSEQRQEMECVAPGTSTGLTPMPARAISTVPVTPKHLIRAHPRPHKKVKTEVSPGNNSRAPLPPAPASWSAMERLLAGARHAGATAPQPEDEDTMFCLSLAPKMKRLPERFKTAAQLRILQVICDYEVVDPSPPKEVE